MDATTVAVDLAKSVFELALADGQWRITARQRLNRVQFGRFLRQHAPTHVVMEACGMAHYWGRVAQGYRHTVTLIPPSYVRPYVRRNKTDRADAEAILEASGRDRSPACRSSASNSRRWSRCIGYVSSG
jgi:transposase